MINKLDFCKENEQYVLLLDKKNYFYVILINKNEAIKLLFHKQLLNDCIDFSMNNSNLIVFLFKISDTYKNIETLNLETGELHQSKKKYTVSSNTKINTTSKCFYLVDLETGELEIIGLLNNN